MGAVLALATAIYEPFTRPPKEVETVQSIQDDHTWKCIQTTASKDRLDSTSSTELTTGVIDPHDENVTIAWLKYWEENGVELTIKSWLYYYKDYLNQDFDTSDWAAAAVGDKTGNHGSQEEHEQLGAGDSASTNSGECDTRNGTESEASALWQEEWKKHCDIVYQEEYQKFLQHYSDSELENMPDDIKNNPKLRKYWYQRYLLFSKYDFGILLDEESWFSVTPEKIAEHIAKKCHDRIGGVVLDGFCGVGGNTIQFAKYFDKVIAIDLDPVKIDHAKNNAIIYGVADKIEFIVGNFMELALELKADVVFLSPPWGGPSYSATSSFDLRKMKPLSGPEIFQVAKAVSPNIAFYAPRNVDRDQLSVLAGPGNLVEIEENKFKGRIKAVTAYYGELIHPRLRKKAKEEFKAME